MRNLLKLVLHLVLVTALNLISAALPLAEAVDAPTKTDAPLFPGISHTPGSADLGRIQTEQDSIKQQASTASSSKQLDMLTIATQQLAGDVKKLTAPLLSERAQLQAQLDVLGPPPAAGATTETPAVAQQRANLNGHKSQLNTQLKQADYVKANLVNLTEQIANLQHGLLKNQLAFRSGSILGAQFWAPLFEPNPADRQRLSAFSADILPVLQSAWHPAQRTGTAFLLLLALAVGTFGRDLLQRVLAWGCLHRLPERRLRRSALALSTALATVLSTGCAVQLVYFVLTRD